jgi:hypothetical protein
MSVSASTPCDIGSVSEACSPTKSPGNRIIDDLTPAVLEGPVAERPTRKNREEMRALCVLRDDRRAGRDNEFAGLEVLQKIDVVGGSPPENFERP